MLIITNFRYGTVAGTLRRLTSKRCKKIKEVRALYMSLGLIDAPCSICKSYNYQLISEADRYGFDIKKQVCLSCHLVQSNPRPSKEFHKEFYKLHYRKLYKNKDYVNYGSTHMKAESIIKGQLLIDTFQKVDINDLKNYNMIEIGCSHGGILKYLEPFAKSVHGYDLDKDAIKYGKNNFKLNLHIGEGPTESMPGKNIIILSHVL